MVVMAYPLMSNMDWMCVPTSLSCLSRGDNCTVDLSCDVAFLASHDLPFGAAFLKSVLMRLYFLSFSDNRCASEC